MTSERWERTKQILENAVRLAPKKRAAFLDCACGGDAELRIIPNRVSGYRLENGQWKNPPWIAPSLSTTADGKLYTNISAMAEPFQMSFLYFLFYLRSGDNFNTLYGCADRAGSGKAVR